MDIGLIWAKYMNTWGQVGTVASTVNFVMMLGVFYTTTLRPAFEIPLWIYIIIVLIGMTIVIAFVLTIGISGYYRFFSNNSELSETNRRVQEANRKIELVMKHLGIEDNGKENK